MGVRACVCVFVRARARVCERNRDEVEKAKERIEERGWGESEWGSSCF